MANNKDTDDGISRKVWRYEEMLRSKAKVYFDEDDLLDIAEYYYYDMSKDAEALRCLDYALSLHPESLPAKLRKAEIRYFQGGKAEAWSLLKSVPEQDDPDVLYYQGLFSLEEKDLTKAEMYYRKAYSQEQGTGIDLFCSILTDYMEHNAAGELEKWLNLLPAVYHDDTRVVNLKIAYLQMTNRPAEAVALTEKLIDREPYNAEYWITLTKLYMQLGEFGKARDSNAYIADIEPGSRDAMLFSADIEFLSGNIRLAHSLYDKYISLEDKNAYAYFNNAFCLVDMYEFDAALRQLHYARKFAEEGDSELRKKICLLTTSVLICGNSLDKAKKELEKARKGGFLPDDEYRRSCAMILFKGGKTAEAGRILDGLLMKDLKEGVFPEQVCFAYIMLDCFDGLAKALDTAAKFCASSGGREKFDGESAPFYAFYYYEKRERKMFLSYLKKAVDSAPETAARLFGHVFPESVDVKDYYAYAERGMLKMSGRKIKSGGSAG